MYFSTWLYNISFTSSPCCSVSYYNYISVWLGLSTFWGLFIFLIKPVFLIVMVANSTLYSTYFKSSWRHNNGVTIVGHICPFSPLLGGTYMSFQSSRVNKGIGLISVIQTFNPSALRYYIIMISNQPLLFYNPLLLLLIYLNHIRLY